jgi:phage terminase large subunit-like protein
MQAFLASLTPIEALALQYQWDFWARPEQLAPDSAWRTWLILAGRGFGKSRAGAEWVRAEVESGRRKRIALVTTNPADAREVMIEGESGLLSVCSPDQRPTYNPSLRKLTWPNSATATTYSAETPDQLRGPQHDGAWIDELCKFRFPADTLDMLMLGLRLGDDPRMVITTTPRPIPALKKLLTDTHTIVTRGSTYDNLPNLAPTFRDTVLSLYEGTRLGRQELYAELLEDVPGALWKRAELDAHRVTQAPPLKRIVIGIDPAATSTEGANETGIIVAGIGDDGHGYVLADLSGRYTPGQWGARAVRAFDDWKADRIVPEVNNGGEMVTHTVQTAARDLGIAVRVHPVHASRGKQTRAEPIAALYEQGKVHHVGNLAMLEDQLSCWTPDDDSPDRMDSLVWALTDLLLGKRRPEWVIV